MNKYNQFFLMIFGLLMPVSACANVIFPTIISRGSWELIIISLVIEYVCMMVLIKKQYVKLAIAVTLANAVSGFVGWLLSIGSTYALYLITPQFVVASSIWGYLSGVEFYCMSVFINTCIEGLIIMLFFREIKKKSIFLYVLLANVLSVAAGLIGLELYSHLSLKKIIYSSSW